MLSVARPLNVGQQPVALNGHPARVEKLAAFPLQTRSFGAHLPALGPRRRDASFCSWSARCGGAPCAELASAAAQMGAHDAASTSRACHPTGDRVFNERRDTQRSMSAGAPPEAMERSEPTAGGYVLAGLIMRSLHHGPTPQRNPRAARRHLSCAGHDGREGCEGQRHSRLDHPRHVGPPGRKAASCALPREQAADARRTLPQPRPRCRTRSTNYAAVMSTRLADGDVANLRVHVMPSIGQLALDEVTPADVKAIRDKVIASGVRRGTQHKVLGAARRLFMLAIEDELIEHNPARTCASPSCTGPSARSSSRAASWSTTRSPAFSRARRATSS